MDDDDLLDTVVAEARRALRNMPTSNGAIADKLPPELHRAFMMRSIDRYLSTNPDSESGPSIFDTMDDPGMDDPTGVTLRLPRWHIEAMQKLAEKNRHGGVNTAYEYIIEAYAMNQQSQDEGLDLGPLGT